MLVYLIDDKLIYYLQRIFLSNCRLMRVLQFNIIDVVSLFLQRGNWKLVMKVLL